VLATLNSPPGRAAAGQHADALAAKLEGFAGVAAVTPPKLDQARTAALIDVIPSSAPSAPPTAALVTSLRDQAGTIRHATGAAIADVHLAERSARPAGQRGRGWPDVPHLRLRQHTRPARCQ